MPQTAAVQDVWLGRSRSIQRLPISVILIGIAMMVVLSKTISFCKFRSKYCKTVKKSGVLVISAGIYLMKLLEAYGVKIIFGIPGVHTVELYRGLSDTIRHVTPRHEQSAGFMATGYARTAKNPGVCLVISGPGLTHIASAMGQAYADSVPMR